MKSLMLLFMLALTCQPVFAEWEYVASSDFYAHYIDPESEVKNGDFIKIWEVDDQAEEDSRGVLSLRAYTEYACQDRAYRIIHLSGHSKPMTAGKVIFSKVTENPWSPIVPGSLGEATLDRLCDD